MPRIFTINPGSTSTKIALFDEENLVFQEEIQHNSEDLAPYEGKPVREQYAMRRDLILQHLKKRGISLDSIDAYSARGGLLWPLPKHGTYAVDELMLRDVRAGVQGDHACNLGALLADDLAGRSTPKKPMFVVDPGIVDERLPRTKIVGIKGIRRKAVGHVLNQIAEGHRYAREIGRPFEELNLIICHVGGGISIGAHRHGVIVDFNDSLTGEGPFSPERSGTVPPGDLIELCFSGKYTKSEIKALNTGLGGLRSLLGTNNFREVEARYLAKDPEVVDVFEAMTYQIAKACCAVVPAFDGVSPDQIILTGGLARSNVLVEQIRTFTQTVAPMTVYPGENEMLALAQGALRVLSGEEPVLHYYGKAE